MSKTKHVFEDKSFKKPTPCDLCNVCYLLFSNKKRKPKKIFLFFSKITFFCRFKPYLNSFTNLIVHLSFVFFLYLFLVWFCFRMLFGALAKTKDVWIAKNVFTKNVLLWSWNLVLAKQRKQQYVFYSFYVCMVVEDNMLIALKWDLFRFFPFFFQIFFFFLFYWIIEFFFFCFFFFFVFWIDVLFRINIFF